MIISYLPFGLNTEKSDEEFEEKNKEIFSLDSSISMDDDNVSVEIYNENSETFGLKSDNCNVFGNTKNKRLLFTLNK